MTSSEMLAKIAFAGSRGINPFSLTQQHAHLVFHLLNLRLIFTGSGGNLHASTEHGGYPRYDCLGVVRSERRYV